MDVMDHKSIDKDVPYFKDVVRLVLLLLVVPYVTSLLSFFFNIICQSYIYLFFK